MVWPVTASQYRAALRRLGQNQIGMATLFNVDVRTIRRWERVGVTGVAAVLLRLYFDRTITAKEIIDAHRGL